MSDLRSLLPVVAGFFFVFVAGCSDPKGPQAVSGTITLKGQPLDQGTISFIPVDPSKGTMGGTTISNGQYSLPRAQGLAPGEYNVQISSPQGGTQVVEGPPGASGPVAKERIPPEYNTETKQRVTVTPSGPNVFNFTIP